MDRLRIRIFVSSPSDVRPERLIAERVVQKLARELQHHCDVEAVLWEREPLVAGLHFQDFRNIPPPRTTDICVVVLWSRLGVPLPPDEFIGALSGKPVTGTEWEFEDALASYRERGLPDLLLYQKTAAPMADLSDRSAVEERLRQSDPVRKFLEFWLEGADGASFTAASHAFAATAEFEERLEEHLRALLRRRLAKDLGFAAEIGMISWTEPPWRGLAAFEAEHAAVFFGRTRARNEAREKLAAQADAGKAFLLVMGASGSGKSSLVKAGLLPDLMLPGMIGRVALVRHGGLRPSDAEGDAMLALAAAVVAALPELMGLRYTAERLAEQLRRGPDQVSFAVEQGLAEASHGRLTTQGEARLVLVVDQLEELFTVDRITPAEREMFVSALDALARCGLVWVIATMRSDFFDRLESLPALAVLSEGGQYLLVPPTIAELGQMVRRPAQAAGLRFEVDEAAGEGLDDVIVKAAAADPGALPLLSFALDQLWQRRDQGSGRLTLRAYCDLGGFEGALGHRAEEIFQALPQHVHGAFPGVLLALVTVGMGPTAKATARTAPLAMFIPGTPASALVEALLAPAARLLVADGELAKATVRIAHETLLAAWPRARDEINRRWEDLQRRARAEAGAALWVAEGRPASRLLPAGLALSEAEETVKRFPQIDTEISDYVGASRAALMRSRFIRSGIALAIFLGIGIGGTLGYREVQQLVAYRQARLAEASRIDIRGTLTAYSTLPGQSALDGPRHNGLYTESLLKYLGDRTLSADQVLLRANQALLQSPDNEIHQTPEYSSSLNGPIYLYDPPSTRRTFVLVIGVSDYENLPRLLNPQNDAHDIAEKLRGIGYNVQLGINETQQEIKAAFDRFLRAIEAPGKEAVANPLPSVLHRGAAEIERTTSANPNTLAIVYLSGQGAEVRGREYLAARDSQVASEDDLVRLIDVTEFISKLQERSAAQIIIFDYCRDNPFEKSNPR